MPEIRERALDALVLESGGTPQASGVAVLARFRLVLEFARRTLARTELRRVDPERSPVAAQAVVQGRPTARPARVRARLARTVPSQVVVLLRAAAIVAPVQHPLMVIDRALQALIFIRARTTNAAVMAWQAVPNPIVVAVYSAIALP